MVRLRVLAVGALGFAWVTVKPETRKGYEVLSTGNIQSVAEELGANG